MASDYDDGLWSAAGEQRRPPAHVREFVGSLGPVRRMLDLGGGDGQLAAELDADQLTLAEPSAVAIERARRRLPGARMVELEIGRPLPLADNEFDLVLCAYVLEHVRDLQLLLSEVRRVLVPGGLLAVATPAHGRATGLRILAGGLESAFDPRSPRLRFFTRRSLARLVDDLGFEVERIVTRRGTLLAVARR